VPIVLAYAEPPAVVAPKPPPNGITQPEWLRLPNATDLAKYYPAEAGKNRVEGRSTIRCQVNSDGRLVDCEVESEEPADAGFGAAAINLAVNSFKMLPKTKDGSSVAGGTVRIPIRFTLPAVRAMTSEELEANAAPCPSKADFRYYPERAAKTNVTGRAVLNCNVSASGSLDQCLVVNEEPKFEGFGRTAVLMARCLMKSKTGQAGRTEFPIRFQLPK
jgi:TonB family protein